MEESCEVIPNPKPNPNGFEEVCDNIRIRDRRWTTYRKALGGSHQRVSSGVISGFHRVLTTSNSSNSNEDLVLSGYWLDAAFGGSDKQTPVGGRVGLACE